MDEFYLKCPYCDSGTLSHSGQGAHQCDACGQNHDVREEVLEGKDFEISEGRVVSALRVAVRHGWHEEINALLDGGMDMDRIDYDGKTSLKYAVDHIGLDNQEVFVNTSLLLIERGADANICDRDGNCPLHIGVRYACLPVVVKLVENAADVNAVGQAGMTPLHHCGDPLDYLLEELHEESLAPDDDEFSHFFAQKQEEIALYLLSAGANPNFQQERGWTPLSRIAYLGGNPDIAKMLIGHGADKNHRAESGFSPLGYARSKESVSQGHAAVARVLADLGASDIRPGMCFVATGVYGSDDCDPVLVLRWFRDNVLERDRLGKYFIGIYYSIGPIMAENLREMPACRKFMKRILDAMVYRIKVKYDI